MATTDNSTPIWEGSKENAAPLQRGRSIQALERSLAAMDDRTEDVRLQNERKVEYYENLVRPSEAEEVADDASSGNSSSSSNNPLQHWIEYIKFHQETFPSDTRGQFLLLERAFRALNRFPQYANNATFIVSICCNYASKTDQPEEVFQFMFQRNLGTKVAKFYAAWAYVAEKQEDFEEAKKIFELGIRKKAQPMNYLVGRQSHFHRRMARHWINSTAIVDDMEDSSASASAGGRGVLGGLSEEAFRKNDRSHRYQPSRSRGAAHQQQQQRHHSSSSSSQATFVDRSSMRRDPPRSNVVNSGGAFAIFVDGNENHAPPAMDERSFVANPDRQLEREQDRRKENTLETERWNQRGGYAPMYEHAAPPQPTAAATRRARTTTPFQVHVDEALAAQQEEEAKREEQKVETMRRHRDERTFRQRDQHAAGGTVEDKLAKDPLRYVKNPSKLDEDKRRAAKEENKRRAKEKDARMAKLLRNKFGEEQCFHEARAAAHCYTIAPSDWNMNLFVASSRSVCDNESDDDVSMSDRSPQLKVDISFSNKKMPPQRPPPLSNRSFSRNNSFQSYTDPTPRNASTASSTVDEATAVGVVGGEEEPTINTQLAMTAVSMMFTSPAYGLNNSMPPHHPERQGGLGPIMNESGRSETAAGGPDDGMASIDEIHGDEQEDGIMGERIDLAADSSLVVGLEENDGHPSNPHARNNGSPNFEGMALRTLQEDQQSGGSSSVGCGASSSQGSSRRSSGELSQDDPLRQLGAMELNDEPGFQIYEDDDGRDSHQAAQGQHPAPAAAARQLAFHIFQDAEDDGDKKVAAKPKAAPAFEIFHDDAGDGDGNDDDAEENKANKSAFDNLDQELEAMSQVIDELDGEAEAERGKHNAFDVNVPGIKMLQSSTDDSDPPAFGDISRILPLEECTESVGPGVRAASEMALDYLTCHKKDVASAMTRLKERSCKFPPNRRSLFKILQSEDLVCDVASHKLPEPLRLSRQAAVACGTEIRFGKSSTKVERELGRGSYGRVVLLKPDPSCHRQHVALKAQSPTSCLAWEFEILKKVHARVGPQYKGDFPYSVPLSYISLFDGALLAMTAANSSGFNLVDLANVYRSPQHSRSLPEILVMHYTAKMLLRVEEVHWHGKILHCDVKPDNWALCSSIIDGESIQASDLQLIDFGRAIDLTAHQADGRRVLETKFTGTATTKDMMCVSMRQGLPWSFDVDTFGICASVHILLFGCHIEIRQENSKGRWMPKERLRRYHSTIWHEFFDTLLNLKGGVAIGSRPLSLRRLRERFERELAAKEAKLINELKAQASFLPATPPRAY